MKTSPSDAYKPRNLNITKTFPFESAIKESEDLPCEKNGLLRECELPEDKLLADLTERGVIDSQALAVYETIQPLIKAGCSILEPLKGHLQKRIAFDYLPFPVFKTIKDLFELFQGTLEIPCSPPWLKKIAPCLMPELAAINMGGEVKISEISNGNHYFYLPEGMSTATARDIFISQLIKDRVCIPSFHLIWSPNSTETTSPVNFFALAMILNDPNRAKNIEAVEVIVWEKEENDPGNNANCHQTYNVKYSGKDLRKYGGLQTQILALNLPTGALVTPAIENKLMPIACRALYEKSYGALAAETDAVFTEEYSSKNNHWKVSCQDDAGMPIHLFFISGNKKASTCCTTTHEACYVISEKGEDFLYSRQALVDNLLKINRWKNLQYSDHTHWFENQIQISEGGRVLDGKTDEILYQNLLRHCGDRDKAECIAQLVNDYIQKNHNQYPLETICLIFNICSGLAKRHLPSEAIIRIWSLLAQSIKIPSEQENHRLAILFNALSKGAIDFPTASAIIQKAAFEWLLQPKEARINESRIICPTPRGSETYVQMRLSNHAITLALDPIQAYKAISKARENSAEIIDELSQLFSPEELFQFDEDSPILNNVYEWKLDPDQMMDEGEKYFSPSQANPDISLLNLFFLGFALYPSEASLMKLLKQLPAILTSVHDYIARQRLFTKLQKSLPSDEIELQKNIQVVLKELFSLSTNNLQNLYSAAIRLFSRSGEEKLHILTLEIVLNARKIRLTVEDCKQIMHALNHMTLSKACVFVKKCIEKDLVDFPFTMEFIGNQVKRMSSCQNDLYQNALAHDIAPIFKLGIGHLAGSQVAAGTAPNPAYPLSNSIPELIQFVIEMVNEAIHIKDPQAKNEIITLFNTIITHSLKQHRSHPELINAAKTLIIDLFNKADRNSYLKGQALFEICKQLHLGQDLQQELAARSVGCYLDANFNPDSNTVDSDAITFMKEQIDLHGIPEHLQASFINPWKYIGQIFTVPGALEPWSTKLMRVVKAINESFSKETPRLEYYNDFNAWINATLSSADAIMKINPSKIIEIFFQVCSSGHDPDEYQIKKIDTAALTTGLNKWIKEIDEKYPGFEVIMSENTAVRHASTLQMLDTFLGLNPSDFFSKMIMLLFMKPFFIDLCLTYREKNVVANMIERLAYYQNLESASAWLHALMVKSILEVAQDCGVFKDNQNILFHVQALEWHAIPQNAPIKDPKKQLVQLKYLHARALANPTQYTLMQAHQIFLVAVRSQSLKLSPKNALKWHSEWIKHFKVLHTKIDEEGVLLNMYASGMHTAFTDRYKNHRDFITLFDAYKNVMDVLTGVLQESMITPRERSIFFVAAAFWLHKLMKTFSQFQCKTEAILSLQKNLFKFISLWNQTCLDILKEDTPSQENYLKSIQEHTKTFTIMLTIFKNCMNENEQEEIFPIFMQLYNILYPLIEHPNQTNFSEQETWSGFIINILASGIKNRVFENRQSEFFELTKQVILTFMSYNFNNTNFVQLFIMLKTLKVCCQNAKEKNKDQIQLLLQFMKHILEKNKFARSLCHELIHLKKEFDPLFKNFSKEWEEIKAETKTRPKDFNKYLSIIRNHSKQLERLEILSKEI